MTMTRPSGRARRRGFTMLELMAVVAIIVLIAAITVPAFSRMTQGNAQKQAVNVITAYAASARALALNTKRPVALVFYEDGGTSMGASRGQTRMVLARQYQVDTNLGTMTLEPLPGRAPDYLPAGIKVAMLTDNADPTLQYQTEQGVGGTPVNFRALLFDGTGQLVLRRGLLGRQNNPVVDAARITAAWGVPAIPGGSSYPALVVYDGRALSSAVKDQGATASAWLNKNADVIVINANTGNVIR